MARGAAGLIHINGAAYQENRAFPILLSALHAFTGGRVDARSAAIAIAYAANMVFKFGVLCWYNRRLALASSWPMAATLAGGAAAYAARV